MDNQVNHIDNQIREKFEHFAPAPPEHVWEGIRGGIVTGASSSFLVTYWKQIAAAASIILIMGLGMWWFTAGDDASGLEGLTEETIEPQTGQQVVFVDDLESESSEVTIDEINPVQDVSEVELTEPEPNQLVDANYADDVIVVENVTEITDPESTIKITETTEFGSEVVSLTFMASQSVEIENELTPVTISKPLAAPLIPETQPVAKNNGWTHGIYITPEVVLNNYDSVTILPAYSLNYEPTYYINNHWFVRFGAGLNYSRDRGYAKIDFIQNEVIGSYTDVYDITFDSIDGDLVPTYHTKTTEVWDSVRHIHISEVNNKYLYLQVPALFGYYKNESKFKWYFYGGPAVNIRVSEWLDKPQEEYGDVEIINLQNNLPERSPYYFQVWLGAGIEYKIGNQLALAIEPNYRYYFDQVYLDDSYKKGLSGFALRVGLVFTVK